MSEDGAKYLLKCKGRSLSKADSYLGNKDKFYLDKYGCDEIRVKSKY